MGLPGTGRTGGMVLHDRRFDPPVLIFHDLTLHTRRGLPYRDGFLQLLLAPVPVFGENFDNDSAVPGIHLWNRDN